MNQKLDRLKRNLEKYDQLAVAFSGGVDSAFLLKMAYDVLGSRVLAVTIKSVIFPQREEDEAGQEGEEVAAQDTGYVAFDEAVFLVGK